MKTIVKKISDFRDSLQIANAVRKGQKINTIETPEGRSYEIVINC
jgi:hypothetical protein